MKIIPLHSAEPTFLRLSRFEWGVSLFFALLVPLFLQSILAVFGVKTAIPLALSACLVAAADVAVVYAKGKEQDFLMTFIHNARIPDCLIGTHKMPYMPFTNKSQKEVQNDDSFFSGG